MQLQYRSQYVLRLHAERGERELRRADVTGSEHTRLLHQELRLLWLCVTVYTPSVHCKCIHWGQWGILASVRVIFVGVYIYYLRFFMFMPQISNTTCTALYTSLYFMFDGCYSEASVIGKCRNNKRGAAPLFHTVKKGTPTYPAERRPEDTMGQWDVPGAFTAHTTNGSRTHSVNKPYLSGRGGSGLHRAQYYGHYWILQNLGRDHRVFRNCQTFHLFVGQSLHGYEKSLS